MKRKGTFNSNEDLSNKKPRIEYDDIINESKIFEDTDEIIEHYYIIVEDETKRKKLAIEYIAACELFFFECKENINPNAITIKNKINKNYQGNKGKGEYNSPIKLNELSPRGTITGLSYQIKVAGAPVTNTFILSGTKITEVRFKGNKQGGIINSLGSYDKILKKFTHITRFQEQIGKRITYSNNKTIIKANEQRLASFLLQYIKALAKNIPEKNYITIHNLFEVNYNLKTFYEAKSKNDTVKKSFDALLNFVNRSIHNIVNHEPSRRPSYDAENYPYVLSRSHILFSVTAGLILVQKGHLSLKDIFAEDAKYNIVTGKNIDATDVQLQEKFMRLYNFYVEKMLPNKNCLLLPNYIRGMFDIFSAPEDSPGRDYNQLIMNKSDGPHPREIHPADNCTAKRSLNLNY